jgi:hypothetical protein
MNKGLAGIVAIGILVAVAGVGIGTSGPPEVAPANAPAEEFSAARAMEHVNVIAKEPHALGSEEHERVRAYIESELKKAGLEVQVQNAVGVMPKYSSAGSVENVVARWKGTSAGGKSLVLVAHYDSVPAAPGAGDDGAGVAALLETLRALKAGEKPRNNIIFLFTDGEELGLLGASAFAAEHPWAKEIGVVLNFDGRGNRGSVLMFETSEGNAWLVDAFAKTPHPHGSSLAYEAYKRMPNDTDFTVFKKRGAAGMNFAFLEGWNDYHTAHDSPERLDPRSLQHYGSEMLALARQFGNADLSESRGAGDKVYFNLLGDALVRYSTGLGVALALLAAAAVAWLALRELRARRTSLLAILWGAGIVVLSVLLTRGAGALLRRLADWLHGSLLPDGDVGRSGAYMFCLVLVSLTMAAAMYSLWRNKLGLRGLALGALLVWTIAALVTSVWLPGASYLCSWPLLGSVAALAALCQSEEAARRISLAQSGALAGGAIVVGLIFPPTIDTFFAALGLTPAGMAAVSLLLGSSLWLLAPQMEALTRPWRWALPAAGFVAALVAFIVGAVTTRFSVDHPKASVMIYARDADAGKAVWFSPVEAPDEWTEQYLTAKPARGAQPDFFPDAPRRKFLSNNAAGVPLAGADVLLGDEKKESDARTLTLLVMSPRNARSVTLYAPEAEVLSASVSGKPVEHEAGVAGWRLRYTNLPQQGIEVTLKVKGTRAVKLYVVEESPGLPTVPGLAVKPRPDWLIPVQWGDVTLVSRKFTF